MRSQHNAIVTIFQDAEVDVRAKAALEASLAKASIKLLSFRQERCYYVQSDGDGGPLSAEEHAKLLWLLAETFEPIKAFCDDLLGRPACMLPCGPRRC